MSSAPNPTYRLPVTACSPGLPQGAIINVLGAGATMLGLSATIGVLLAKTLTSATVNPFLATSSNNWNPVLAFDVFNVQVGAALVDAAVHVWLAWALRSSCTSAAALLARLRLQPTTHQRPPTPRPPTLPGHHQRAAGPLLLPGRLPVAAAHHCKPPLRRSNDGHGRPLGGLSSGPLRDSALRRWPAWRSSLCRCVQPLAWTEGTHL